jgi:2-polyprenyl-6-methoxyphenol hydroxylase-like FAD-dependent oxidoreductase
VTQNEIVVVGGGVGGLASALILSRAGHRVTVLERDPLPADADPEEAFVADRRGAPQVHQTHGFLARIVVELRQHLPDVLDALIAAGGHTMSSTAELGDPQPGDEDLAVLIVRRTTFEWVLRAAALAEPHVSIRTGVTVAGLLARSDAHGGPPTVTGVALGDGTTIEADLVVAAMGRRSPVPTWLAEHGVDVPETVRPSGLMYLSRWYRLPPGGYADLDPKLGGDLHFVKYLGVPGDGDTLSITLAIDPEDGELRSALSDPDGFELACRLLPGPDQFFGDGPLEPVGGVRPMGGLLNRLRRFTDDDGRPTVLGFHAVGDAHTCTNPLYGRGCSLAVIQALAVAEALAEHPDDPAARALAYETTSAREVEPSYDFAVLMDKAGADPSGVRAADGPGRAMAAVFVAAATDPIIGRGMARLWNLLASIEDLMADAAYATRVMEVMADPDAYPIPDREGPSRRELLKALAEADRAPSTTESVTA